MTPGKVTISKKAGRCPWDTFLDNPPTPPYSLSCTQKRDRSFPARRSDHLKYPMNDSSATS